MTPSRASLYDLPTGYGETRRVQLTERRLLIWLNIIAIVPLILMVIWMAVWWGIASRGRATNGAFDVPWWLAVIIVFVIVLPLHEFLHGITIRVLGYPVRYGANLAKGVLFATSDNALFWRNQYLAIALAPLVGMTVLSMLIMLFASQGLAYYAAIAAVLNAGGAVGDLWSVGVLVRYPASVMIRDEADGFRIYAAGAAETAAGSSIQKTDPPPSP